MNEFMELTGRELDRAVAEALGWTDFSVDSRGLLWGHCPGDPEDEARSISLSLLYFLGCLRGDPPISGRMRGDQREYDYLEFLYMVGSSRKAESS